MSNYAYLAHYGVKGQKHGERRWQNSDGSLTPAGRIHYGVGAARAAVGSAAKNVVKGVGHVTKSAGTAIRKKVRPTNAELDEQISKEKYKIENKQKREELKRLKKTGKIDDQNEKKPGLKRYSEMSDKDVNDRITRLKKEAELAELEASASLGPGKRMVLNAVTKGITTGIQSGIAKGLTKSGETFINRTLGFDTEYNKARDEAQKEKKKQQETEAKIKASNRQINKNIKAREKERKRDQRMLEKVRKKTERDSLLDQYNRTHKNTPKYKVPFQN